MTIAFFFCDWCHLSSIITAAINMFRQSDTLPFAPYQWYLIPRSYSTCHQAKQQRNHQVPQVFHISISLFFARKYMFEPHPKSIKEHVRRNPWPLKYPRSLLCLCFAHAETQELTSSIFHCVHGYVWTTHLNKHGLVRCIQSTLSIANRSCRLRSYEGWQYCLLFYWQQSIRAKPHKHSGESGRMDGDELSPCYSRVFITTLFEDAMTVNGEKKTNCVHQLMTMMKRW